MNCYRHLGIPSAATCVACEQPICEECREEVAGHPMCRSCVAATQARLVEQETTAAPTIEPARSGVVQAPPALMDYRVPSAAPNGGPQAPPSAVPGAQMIDGPPPGLGRRILRGWGWGAVYGQWWTLMTVLSSLLWEHSFPSFGVILVMGFFYGFFGSLAGLVIGAANATASTGMMIGVGTGITLCLLEVLVTHSASGLINLIFYYFTGRYVGAGITGRVQQPIPLKGPMPTSPAASLPAAPEPIPVSSAD
jgi:hypothetical protein